MGSYAVSKGEQVQFIIPSLVWKYLKPTDGPIQDMVWNRCRYGRIVPRRHGIMQKLCLSPLSRVRKLSTQCFELYTRFIFMYRRERRFVFSIHISKYTSIHPQTLRSPNLKRVVPLRPRITCIFHIKPETRR